MAAARAWPRRLASISVVSRAAVVGETVALAAAAASILTSAARSIDSRAMARPIPTCAPLGMPFARSARRTVTAFSRPLVSDRAAAAIGLSLSGYRKQCGGERPVSLQTELLTRYVELFAPAWLDIATAWLDIAHGAQALARRVYPAR